jgi:hypothetical protein
MPKTLPSCDGRVRCERCQAAELLAEPEELDEDDDGFESDDDEDEDVPDDEDVVDDVPDDFDAGLLLDEEPRESLR